MKLHPGSGPHKKTLYWPFLLTAAETPSIAQLVERWTVVGHTSDIHRSLVQIRLEGFLSAGSFPSMHIPSLKNASGVLGGPI